MSIKSTGFPLVHLFIGNVAVSAVFSCGAQHRHVNDISLASTFQSLHRERDQQELTWISVTYAVFMIINANMCKLFRAF